MIEILYVEDDGLSRDVMRMIERMNPNMMQTSIFEDSTDFETRLLALDTMPQVILLDIHMKPYTGFEMLKMIRQHHKYDTIPVVALTASVMNEEVQMLREAGFESVISKPLDMDAFPEALTHILSGEQLWHIQ